jgi:hypothetical protein
MQENAKQACFCPGSLPKTGLVELSSKVSAVLPLGAECWVRRRTAPTSPTTSVSARRAEEATAGAGSLSIMTNAHPAGSLRRPLPPPRFDVRSPAGCTVSPAVAPRPRGACPRLTRFHCAAVERQTKDRKSPAGRAGRANRAVTGNCDSLHHARDARDARDADSAALSVQPGKRNRERETPRRRLAASSASHRHSRDEGVNGGKAVAFVAVYGNRVAIPPASVRNWDSDRAGGPRRASRRLRPNLTVRLPVCRSRSCDPLFDMRPSPRA